MQQNADTAPSIIQHRFSTDEVSQAHDVISQRCAGLALRLRGVATPFSFREELIDAGPVLTSRVRCGMDFELQLEPLKDLLLVAVVNGRTVVRDGRDEAQAGPGGVLLQRTGRPLTNVCDRSELYNISLDARTVTEAAVDKTGIAQHLFRFEAMTPVSEEMGQFWHDTATHLHRLLTGPAEPLRSPLVIHAAADLAASAALAAFPHSAMTMTHRLRVGQLPVGPVRRAVSFIETHCREAITPVQIAEAVRVTPRALRTAFRRHLGTTPRAYLWRARLDGAHQDLLAADPARGDTVAAIAHRWGYLRPSRFASAYREAHGRSPSDTLYS
ncbi:AraC family transcriptional regulator [Micromonospora sp. NPDC005298]|uniref:AraC family transcriptional regulator n=1 Tax=Micromonospora sp. NPDC005298 TaxID=3156873 RepID=UPI0033A97881